GDAGPRFGRPEGRSPHAGGAAQDPGPAAGGGGAAVPDAAGPGRPQHGQRPAVREDRQGQGPPPSPGPRGEGDRPLAGAEAGTLEELLDEAERKIFNLAEKKREGDLKPVRELMDHTLDLIDKMKSNTSGVTGLATGFVDLDLQLTGLHGGELL